MESMNHDVETKPERRSVRLCAVSHCEDSVSISRLHFIKANISNTHKRADDGIFDQAGKGELLLCYSFLTQMQHFKLALGFLKSASLFTFISL